MPANFTSGRLSRSSTILSDNIQYFTFAWSGLKDCLLRHVRSLRFRIGPPWKEIRREIFSRLWLARTHLWISHANRCPFTLCDPRRFFRRSFSPSFPVLRLVSRILFSFYSIPFYASRSPTGFFVSFIRLSSHARVIDPFCTLSLSLPLSFTSYISARNSIQYTTLL